MSHYSEQRRQFLALMHRNRGAQDALMWLSIANALGAFATVLSGHHPYARVLGLAYAPAFVLGSVGLWLHRRVLWRRIEAVNDAELLEAQRAAGYVCSEPR